MAQNRPAPVQAPPDPTPVAGQMKGPVLFGVLILAAMIIIMAGLRATADIIAPVFLVITLVITVAPLRSLLIRRKVPSVLASIIALLAIYGLLFIILGSLVWSIYRLVDKLPDYEVAFQRILDSLLGVADRLGYGTERLRELVSGFQFSSLAAPAQTLLSALSGGASLFILIIAMVLFLTFDAPSMKDRLDVIRETRPHIAEGLSNFAGRVRKYWIVTTIFGAVAAILDVIALWIIGVPLALTWGVLAFVTNYIPNVGFVIGVIPPALIALLDGGVTAMVAVIIVYSLINVVVQTIIQPRFTGDAVGISGTIAFVSLIFWAFLLGPLGALIAIPATLFLKSTLLDNSVPASWVNALISSDPKKDRPRTPRARTRGEQVAAKTAAARPRPQTRQ